MANQTTTTEGIAFGEHRRRYNIEIYAVTLHPMLKLLMLFSNLASATPLKSKRNAPPSTYIAGVYPKMIVAAII